MYSSCILFDFSIERCPLRDSDADADFVEATGKIWGTIASIE